MIDTHCHLVDPQFNKDLVSVLERARHAGVTRIINAGYDVETSRAALELFGSEPWLYPAVGLHPNEAAAESLRDFGRIEALLAQGGVIAIGETGLDYYRDISPRKAQQELFRRHIELARQYDLPLLIHTRNSADEAIRLLKEADYHAGVFHCYSGTYDQAKVIVDRGFYLGFGGVLTFSKQAREVFKKLPADRIVLETDAPFLSPANHRGKRNEPAFIFETLNTAAAIREMNGEEIERLLDANALTLFHFNRE